MLLHLSAKVTGYMRRSSGTDWTNRRRFSLVAIVFATALLAWGAFVTSIDAGLAVPDWPSSFDSYDPFNPWPNWWQATPILAEHGHRLLGALVGLLMMALAFWTWRSDDRPWMRRLAVGALLLVVLQGVLGGLRVVWVSLDLAVVHAAVAQIFYSLLATLTLFISPMWQRAVDRGHQSELSGLRPVTIRAVLAVYIQILLGALLRHPGVGIDPLLAGLHLGFAFVAAATIFHMWITIRTEFENEVDLRRVSTWSLRILFLQVTLGLFAYFILLDERGIVRPSNLQVVVNSSHLVVGAMLLASAVLTLVLVFRLTSRRLLSSETEANTEADTPAID